MTKEEYAEYEKTVAEFLKSEGINCLSSSEDAVCMETFTQCDCCGDRSFGYRYNATGFNPKAHEITEYIVCFECLYYVTYGQLDGMTMMNMED